MEVFSPERLHNRLTNPFNILAILSFVLAILDIVLGKLGIGVWQTATSMLLALALSLLALFAVIRYMSYYRSKPRIEFYVNPETAPQRDSVYGVLSYMERNRGELEIIARTAFQWLCGDERDFEKDCKAFDEKQKELQDQIRETIKSGSSIHFVLQNPNIRVPYFDEKNSKRLQSHLEAAIRSYETIASSLVADTQGKLSLSFSNDVIENSMVRQMEDSRLRRFALALSVGFRAPDESKDAVSKPFLVFRGAGSEYEEYLRRIFDDMKSESISKEVFDEKKKKGLAEVDSLIRKYSHHSIVRVDKSKFLAAKAAHYFLAESNPANATPPACIHLSVTDQCTTHCAMCDHYKLYSNTDELSKDELCNVLDCIKDIGTECVIVSGGEPLARKDLFDVLKYGKKIGLRIGLLTNGVLEGGQALTLEQADIISNVCDWVQLSIDSFNKDTYKLIRGGDYLGAAIESLKELAQCNTKIEISYTIQKKNVGEIATVLSDIDKHLIPLSVILRFKFAHGPANSRDFLCSTDELRQAIRDLPSNMLFNVNSEYLKSMIDNGWFDYEGLSLGHPLKKIMTVYESQEYTCHALRLTCMVDSKGDVYPCCFLFDDNRASSNFRHMYRIGSLRSRTGVVPRVTKGRNPLAHIWYNSTDLNACRQKPLPINSEACYCCTRYFYQNGFLNELCRIYRGYKEYGVAESVLRREETEDFFLWRKICSQTSPNLLGFRIIQVTFPAHIG